MTALDDFLNGLLKNVTTGAGQNQLPQAQPRPAPTAYGSSGTPSPQSASTGYDSFISSLLDLPKTREPIPVANPRREPMPNSMPEPYQPPETPQIQAPQQPVEQPAEPLQLQPPPQDRSLTAPPTKPVSITVTPQRGGPAAADNPQLQQIAKLQQQLQETPEDAPDRYMLFEALAGYKAAYYQTLAAVEANNGNMEEADRLSKLAPKPSIADIRDVENFTDFMKYGYYYLANMAPEAVGTAAAGLAGSAVGGPAVGGAAFLTASGYMHRGRNLLAQWQETGKTDGELATAAALVQASLDRVGMAGIAGRTMNKLLTRTAGAVAERGILGRIAVEGTKGTFGEGAAEFGQQFAQELAVSDDRLQRILDPQTPEDEALLDDIINSSLDAFVNGAVLGGIAGGGAGVIRPRGIPSRDAARQLDATPDGAREAALMQPLGDIEPGPSTPETDRTDAVEQQADAEEAQSVPVTPITYTQPEAQRPAPYPLPDEPGAPSSLAREGVRFTLGPKRPNPPSPELTGLLQNAAVRALGEGTVVEIYSGQENPGEQHGAHRHPTGLAADLRVYDPSGKLVKIGTPEHEALARSFASSGAMGMGFGRDYMGDGFHVDLIGSQSVDGKRGGNIWGSGALAMQGELLPMLQQNQRAGGAQYGPDLAASIRASARQLGIDPFVLATVISYETAGTFNPAIAGGAGGAHRGLIQWSPENLQSYEVNLDDVGGQMQAVTRYLYDRGVRPGMGLLEVYAAINGGNVNAINASDAANGGRPGDVSWKVANDMDGHMENARRLLGGEGGSLPGGGRTGTVPGTPGGRGRGREGDQTVPDEETRRAVDAAEEQARRSERGEASAQPVQDQSAVPSARFEPAQRASVQTSLPEVDGGQPVSLDALQQPAEAPAQQPAAAPFDYAAYTAKQETERRRTGRDTIGAPRGANPQTLPPARPGRTVLQRSEDLSASLTPGQQQRVIREKLTENRAGADFNAALQNTLDAAITVAHAELDRLGSTRTPGLPADVAKLNKQRADTRAIIEQLQAAKDGVTALSQPAAPGATPEADVAASQAVQTAFNIPSDQLRGGLSPVRAILGSANRLVRVAPLQGAPRQRPRRAMAREFQRLDSTLGGKGIPEAAAAQRQAIRAAAARAQQLPSDRVPDVAPQKAPTDAAVREMTREEVHRDQTVGMVGLHSQPWSPNGVQSFTYQLMYGSPPPPGSTGSTGSTGSPGGPTPPAPPPGILQPSGSRGYGLALAKYATRELQLEFMVPKIKEQAFDPLFSRQRNGRGPMHEIRVLFAEGNSLRTRWRNVMNRTAERVDKTLDPSQRKRVDTLMLRTAFLNTNLFDPVSGDLVDPLSARSMRLNPKRRAPTQAQIDLFNELLQEPPEVVSAMGELFKAHYSLSSQMVLQVVNAELNNVSLPAVPNIDAVLPFLQTTRALAALDPDVISTMAELVEVVQSGNYVPAARTGNYFVNASQVMPPITGADADAVRAAFKAAKDANPSLRPRGGGAVQPTQLPNNQGWALEVEMPFSAAFDTRRQANAMEAELRRHMQLGTAVPDVETGVPFIPTEVGVVQRAREMAGNDRISATSSPSLERLARGDNAVRNALMELNLRRSVRTSLANRENVLGGSYDAIARARAAGHNMGMQLANVRTRGKIQQVIADMQDDQRDMVNRAVLAADKGNKRLADNLRDRAIVMQQLVNFTNSEFVEQGKPDTAAGKYFAEMANNVGQVARWVNLNSFAYAYTNAHQPLVNGLGEMAGIYGPEGIVTYGQSLTRAYNDIGFAIRKFRARRGLLEQNTLWAFKEYIEDAEFISRDTINAVLSGQGAQLAFADVASPTQFNVDAQGNPDGLYLSEADFDLLLDGRLTEFEAEVLSRGYRDGSVGAKIADVLDETQLQQWIEKTGGGARNAVSFANLFPGIFLAQVVERANRTSVTYAVASLEQKRGSTVDQAAVAHEEMQRRINISYERQNKVPLMRRLGGMAMFTAYPIGIITNNALALGSLFAGQRLGYTRAGAAMTLGTNFAILSTLGGVVSATPWLIHQGLQAATLIAATLFGDDEDEEDFLDDWRKYGRADALQFRVDAVLGDKPWSRGVMNTLTGADMRTRLSVAEAPILAFSEGSITDGPEGLREVMVDALGPVVDTGIKQATAAYRYASGESTWQEAFERIGPKWTRDAMKAYNRSQKGLGYGTETRIKPEEYSDIELFMQGLGLSLTRESNYYSARRADSYQKKMINKLNSQIKDRYFENTTDTYGMMVPDYQMMDLQEKLSFWTGEALTEKQLDDSLGRKLKKQEKLDENAGLTPTTKADQPRVDRLIDRYQLRD